MRWARAQADVKGECCRTSGGNPVCAISSKGADAYAELCDKFFQLNTLGPRAIRYRWIFLQASES